ncbi:MAG: NADH-quinone oxidoreductase subunit M [Bdellovibrionales bacterium]|nr:NADH-quinone oxidoreductase subunit M [Bdellovibrionales bacterium]
MLSSHILSWMTFTPLLGAVIVLMIPKCFEKAIKIVSLITTAIPLTMAVYLFQHFDRDQVGMQFMERHQWIPSFNIQYIMGTDGISVTMLMLTALLSFLCVIASWNIGKKVKGYFFLFLLLETGMMGVFAALDLFLFYIFWEVMLLPMYFLIGIWGGARREYAAIKFFIYTLVGSVFMLLGFLAIYFWGPSPHSFDMIVLGSQGGILSQGILFGLPMSKVVFLALFFGFAIKVPMFPFHTWLPDAHVEAPTAVSVILAGVLLKMGVYGVFRICYPFFPDAAQWFAPILAILAVINILYGGLCAMNQKDIKKLVAYSSVSHMGYCLLGLAAMTFMGLEGSLFQMFTHGTSTAMLFLLVGVIYDRAHTRGVNDFGGLASAMPKYTFVAMIAFFASMGLPGLSGFISEVFVLLGSFHADAHVIGFDQAFRGQNIFIICTIFAALGVVITAAYLLWTIQRVFLGSLPEKWSTLKDINTRELITLVPLAFLAIALGIYPMPILDLFHKTLSHFSQFLTAGG